MPGHFVDAAQAADAVVARRRAGARPEQGEESAGEHPIGGFPGTTTCAAPSRTMSLCHTVSRSCHAKLSIISLDHHASHVLRLATACVCDTYLDGRCDGSHNFWHVRHH